MVKAEVALNWDDLKYFLYTARTGRLSAAGGGLGVDHTTVRRRIAALEQVCDARLFDRSPSGYALTEAGRRLLPHAEAIESGVLAATDAIGERGQQLAGAIRIGAPEDVANTILAECAVELCRENSHLDVQIVALPRQFSLSKREADFAIGFSRPTTGRLKVYKICDYRLRLYATETFLSNSAPIKTGADLKRVRGVGYIRDLIFDKSLDYVANHDPNLHQRMTSTSIMVQVQMALAHGGVCVLPEFLARRYPDLKVILPDEICLTRSLWMILHEDLASLARIKHASSYIAEYTRALFSNLDKELGV